MQKQVERFADTRILVIGDVILDQFIWGNVSRISPEAPVPVVNVTREELLLGGSANVLRNIISLGGSCALCGIIGDDPMGDELLALMEKVGAPVEGLIKGERPTTIKTRVVAQGQQVVRYDREKAGVPSRQTLESMLQYLTGHLADFDAVIVSDYAKGVVNEELMTQLHRLLKELRHSSGRAIPLIVDPKPDNLHRFVGATVITPNNFEATRISGIDIRDEETLLAAARQIREEISCEAVLITRGEAGMALLEGDDSLVTIPTMAQEVYDVTGAGDTVAATLALGLAAGCSMTEAAVLANHAAGIVVGKIGTASVSCDELLAALA
ncbi:D-glycero-beta-D-manno-heptose-7-phosphate kinase [Desulfobulbus sp. US1]|nr:D-glycero-beta-D-manno-heptose-7-phosphate kinase [Desulfobulbus sp. US4]MCW5207158.1 D-glycero-beta-D-manno-heptose-7-phosphate kinase [Desulfobulbus sp. US2]MCW5208752.1 D-glycero-beta-D-manno-heptose-7-phosphate kinase [Desulfobulbus sp. US1]MCW5213775.1 D-glycero-beta-D-manno-heptose-7-phosphate kinase [Desulfobulbus sp. US5]